jgi:hypothetical protein
MLLRSSASRLPSSNVPVRDRLTVPKTLATSYSAGPTGLPNLKQAGLALVEPSRSRESSTVLTGARAAKVPAACVCRGVAGCWAACGHCGASNVRTDVSYYTTFGSSDDPNRDGVPIIPGRPPCTTGAVLPPAHPTLVDQTPGDLEVDLLDPKKDPGRRWQPQGLPACVGHDRSVEDLCSSGIGNQPSVPAGPRGWADRSCCTRHDRLPSRVVVGSIFLRRGKGLCPPFARRTTTSHLGPLSRRGRRGRSRRCDVNGPPEQQPDGREGLTIARASVGDRGRADLRQQAGV